jgi:hypothetical protein
MKQRDEVRAVTDDEAKGTVEEKLRKQQLTKPMSQAEMTAFCQAMVRNLEMKSASALSEVRGWAESWQSAWFRPK